MGIFNRRSKAQQSPALQPPDEHAALGAAALDKGQAMAALESYGNAVDKQHTMYVIGGCAHRQPSFDDAEILEGLVESARQTIGMPGASPIIEKSCVYLGQVAQAVSDEAANSMYLAYIDQLQRL